MDGEFIIPFEADGSIGKDYGFSGKVSDALINLTKEFSIKDLTTEIKNINRNENNGNHNYSVGRTASTITVMEIGA